MPEKVIYEHELDVRDQFRQSYTPGDKAPRGDARHWILDFPSGRDLLKTAARKYKPEERLPVFGHSPGIDMVLDAMIDQLGLRDMPEPEAAFQKAKLNFKFLWMMVKLQFTTV